MVTVRQEHARAQVRGALRSDLVLFAAYIIVVCLLGGLAAGAIVARITGTSSSSGPGLLQAVASVGAATLGGFWAAPTVSAIQRLCTKVVERAR